MAAAVLLLEFIRLSNNCILTDYWNFCLLIFLTHVNLLMQ